MEKINNKNIWEEIKNKISKEIAFEVDTICYSGNKIIKDVESLELNYEKCRVLIIGEISYNSLICFLAAIRLGYDITCIDRDIDATIIPSLPFDICLASEKSKLFYLVKPLGLIAGEVVFGDIQVYKNLHKSNVNSSINTGINFLTSGSTGISKIIHQSYNSIYAFAQESIQKFSFNSQTRLLIMSSFMWDLIIIELISVLLAGGCCVAGHPSIVKNPLSYILLIKQRKINTLQLAPSFMDAIIHFTRETSCTEVTTIILTGEPIFGRHRYCKLFPKAIFISAYGACEIHNAFSINLSENMLSSGSVPLGKPWDVVESYKLEPISFDNYRLHFKIKTIMDGFIANSRFFQQDSAYYCNNDIFKVQEDKLYFNGRLMELLGVELSTLLFKMRQSANYYCDMELKVLYIDAIFNDGVINFITSNIDEARAIARNLEIIKMSSSISNEKVNISICKRIPRTLHGKPDVKKLSEMFSNLCENYA